MAVKKKPSAAKPKSKLKAAKKTSASKTKSPAKAKKPAPKKAAAKKKKKKKGDVLMCFLTTACVRYYGLKDDGYELNTLRNFRDTYLANSEGGKELIQEYYKLSPEIVKQIEQDKNKNATYSYIHGEVLRACKQIDTREPQLAKETYLRMVQRLMVSYL